MKRRVVNRFRDYVRCELPIKDGMWPTHAEIVAMLVDNPHFDALRDVGLPADHAEKTGRETLLAEIAYYVVDVMRRVEERWIARKVHDCMGAKELELCMAKEIGVLPAGYSDALTLIQHYYETLATSISDTLIHAIPGFGRLELEMMVPRVESPFYQRERIIDEYLRRAPPPGI